MTDVTTLLAGIKERALAALDYPGHVTVEQSAADVPRLVAAIEAVEDLAKRLRDNRPGDPDSAFDRGYAMGRRAAGDLVSNIIAAALGEGA